MKQLFVMIVGFSRSGKTSLAKKIQKEFPDKFIKIDSDSIHSFLNKTYKIFNDGNTVNDKSWELRQITSMAIRKALFNIFIKNNFSILSDSCNLIKTERQKILKIVKGINKKIKIVIIDNKISEKQLYKNLKMADDKLIKRGKKTTWIKLYEKIQKPKFNPPKKNEADHFLVRVNNNTKTILNKLKNIN